MIQGRIRRSSAQSSTPPKLPTSYTKSNLGGNRSRSLDGLLDAPSEESYIVDNQTYLKKRDSNDDDKNNNNNLNVSDDNLNKTTPTDATRDNNNDDDRDGNDDENDENENDKREKRENFPIKNSIKSKSYEDRLNSDYTEENSTECSDSMTSLTNTEDNNNDNDNNNKKRQNFMNKCVNKMKNLMKK